ncbi:family 16 glycosylhydrolase [Paucibacter sp. KBW04]|uniref:glycoside hydrolase family 16 protein n=1 Tax=Paucibacter sp. KBW04 TaxID=2153361 RepID=UPI001E4B1B04|nr:glycoside hydrolase family 16 protein [Paucibacter sp. KBW04]
MKKNLWITSKLLAATALGLLLAAQAQAERILFIGNSFTYGQGSVLKSYRPDTVIDLNKTGVAGVPALFKAFSAQAGLAYEVSVETQGGVGLDWHLAQRSDLLASQSWDRVVMQGYSTLDKAHPGRPDLLVKTSQDMAALLRRRNPEIAIHLMATWARADQLYQPGGAWWERGVEAMTRDLRSGYEQAQTALKKLPGAEFVQPVVPVGQAWQRAIQQGLAARDPYRPLAEGQLDLWAADRYHASVYGSYLESLVLFGAITHLDPRSLGASECAAYDLGLSRDQARALQRVAFEQLAAEPGSKIQPMPTAETGVARSCAELLPARWQDERLTVPPGYKLVWADEFERPGLPDTRKWNYDTGRNATGWDNHELQYYARARRANSEVKGGQLLITARKEDMSRAKDSMGQRYSSARLLTLGKAEWTYGFFEIRAQLPCGQGTWPAIWMLNSAVVWPAGGELDIMEQVGSRPQRLFSTVHSAAGSGSEGVGAATQIEDACLAMHNYQMLWTADEVSFAIDGRVHHRYRKQDHAGAGWPFDKPQFLILNIAIGGDLGGTVDDSIFPVQMRVAHVRVYQASRP